MRKPLLPGEMELAREVVIIDDQGGKRMFLLKCSRRKLLALLDAVGFSRSSQPV